jgi:hypothetical protein
MDFVTLATELDTRRMLRALTDVLAEDDDASSTPHSIAVMVPQSSGSILTDPEMVAQKPLFSKTAEAELYLLATNFLLYVAMVIITTMVSKSAGKVLILRSLVYCLIIDVTGCENIFPRVPAKNSIFSTSLTILFIPYGTTSIG